MTADARPRPDTVLVSHISSGHDTVEGRHAGTARSNGPAAQSRLQRGSILDDRWSPYRRKRPHAWRFDAQGSFLDGNQHAVQSGCVVCLFAEHHRQLASRFAVARRRRWLGRYRWLGKRQLLLAQQGLAFAAQQLFSLGLLPLSAARRAQQQASAAGRLIASAAIRSRAGNRHDRHCHRQDRGDQVLSQHCCHRWYTPVGLPWIAKRQLFSDRTDVKVKHLYHARVGFPQIVGWQVISSALESCPASGAQRVAALGSFAARSSTASNVRPAK